MFNVYIHSHFNQIDVLTSVDRAQCFTRKFSLIFNIDRSGVSRHNFPIKPEALLSNMHITPYMVSAIISNMDPYKACGTDDISVKEMFTRSGPFSL